MILCTHCETLWPAGSEYCGSCGASLGKRICANGHEVDLDAKFCTKCGTGKLTRGVEAVEYRPLVLLFVVISAAVLILVFQSQLLNLLSALGAFAVKAVCHFLGILVICSLGGKEAVKAWLGLCSAILRLCWAVIAWLVKSLI
ncbi:MAG: zinc ribbon domain-containing protein [Armatimonadetes bacterium]|nr:zinc ribbon domain-containing protein [Armatimonadota bacterium]